MKSQQGKQTRMCDHRSCNKRLTKILNDKRVSFMMAWNRRLGERSLISRYVPKDVGKLIAKQYITLKSQRHALQSVYRYNGTAVLPRHANVVFCMKHPTRKQEDLHLHRFTYLNLCLQECSEIAVQTPLMRIPFQQDRDIDAHGNQSELKNLVMVIADKEKDNWFLDWMDQIDEQVMSVLYDEQVPVGSMRMTLGMMKEMFMGTFRRSPNPDRDFPPTFKVRITPKSWDHVMVYLTRDRARPYGTLRQAFQDGLLGRGALVRAIVKHVGVWEMRRRRSFSTQWEIAQILIDTSSKDIEERERAFAFVNDSDSE